MPKNAKSQRNFANQTVYDVTKRTLLTFQLIELRSSFMIWLYSAIIKEAWEPKTQGYLEQGDEQLIFACDTSRVNRIF